MDFVKICVVNSAVFNFHSSCDRILFVFKLLFAQTCTFDFLLKKQTKHSLIYCNTKRRTYTLPTGYNMKWAPASWRKNAVETFMVTFCHLEIKKKNILNQILPFELQITKAVLLAFCQYVYDTSLQWRKRSFL